MDERFIKLLPTENPWLNALIIGAAVCIGIYIVLKMGPYWLESKGYIRRDQRVYKKKPTSDKYENEECNQHA